MNTKNFDSMTNKQLGDYLRQNVHQLNELELLLASRLIDLVRRNTRLQSLNNTYQGMTDAIKKIHGW